MLSQQVSVEPKRATVRTWQPGAFVGSCRALSKQIRYVFGKQSFLTGNAVISQRIQLVPQLEWAEYDGNHHLHLEPETFKPVVEMIERFLAQ